VGGYPKAVVLGDGTEVLIRPMEEDDLEASHRFFLALPPEDRYFLRINVCNLEDVRIRMVQADAREHWRLAALCGEEIIGDATLYQARYGWMRHTAEIRCIVAREYQGRGLGSILLNELFQEATRRKIERLYGKVIPEQHAALRILEGLGFRRELTLRDRRRTLDGAEHDVIVMTISIRALWRRLEDLMQTMDGRGRERH